MASKQLGKLRQWGREVISSKEKTVLSEEFKSLEQDVDLRRIGLLKLHGASAEYHASLHKKKEYPAIEQDVLMLPVDALGAVMMAHGQEFGDKSAFGQCLLKFGRAHCKIATLQESYALTFRETYLANLEAALDELTDYATQRKKLDSRRLAFDAAVTKSSKAKKEKDVRDAEEELSRAKLRYEETTNDVQARMRMIQEKEIQHLRALTEFLATETRFVEQYLDVLRDAQDEWLDESVIQQPDITQPRTAPHTFGRSTPSISSTSKVSAGRRTPEAEREDYGFGRRERPSTPRRSTDEGPSKRGRASPSTPRPSSRASHTSDGGSKRLGVAGWASSAVLSLAGSRNKKDKAAAGRAFASLENDGLDAAPNTSSSSSSSFNSYSPRGGYDFHGRDESESDLGFSTVQPTRAVTSIAQRAEAETASLASSTDIDATYYDEPFGDHHLAKSPLAGEHEHDDAPSEEDEDDMRGLFARVREPPDGEVGNAAGNGVAANGTGARVPPALPQRKQSVKKPPPPPPPPPPATRRSTVGASAAPAPANVATSTAPHTSAPSSMANLAAAMTTTPAMVSFPPAPRPQSSTRTRTRSTPSSSTASVSPFEN